jgi:hypothetical protein
VRVTAVSSARRTLARDLMAPPPAARQHHQWLRLVQLMGLSAALATATVPTRPHVLLVLADDTGYNNVGWHASSNAARAEVHTPILDGLVSEGIDLERAIAFKYCSPSRCALQSGR